MAKTKRKSGYVHIYYKKRKDGGYDWKSTNYDFRGQVTKNKWYHTKITTLSNFKYTMDHTLFKDDLTYNNVLHRYIKYGK